jgi:hypothetical protein
MDYQEYINAVHDRFDPDDISKETDRAAEWIWFNFIDPLKAELKAAEERADDAISGFNKGLDY